MGPMISDGRFGVGDSAASARPRVHRRGARKVDAAFHVGAARACGIHGAAAREAA